MATVCKANPRSYSSARRLTNSAAFGTVPEGMDLVEQTAAYLDGDGRSEAKALERSVQSHLCDRKHAADHTADAACILAVAASRGEGRARYPEPGQPRKTRSSLGRRSGPEDMIAKLPQQLQDLISRSMNLQSRVRRLDVTIHAPATERAPIGNPLVPQLNRLKAAFEQ